MLDNTTFVLIPSSGSWRPRSEAAPMSGESYSRVPDKVSPENLTRAAPGGKGVGLTDFSALERNTFDQYRADFQCGATNSRIRPKAAIGRRDDGAARNVLLGCGTKL